MWCSGRKAMQAEGYTFGRSFESRYLVISLYYNDNLQKQTMIYENTNIT